MQLFLIVNRGLDVQKRVFFYFPQTFPHSCRKLVDNFVENFVDKLLQICYNAFKMLHKNLIIQKISKEMMGERRYYI